MVPSLPRLACESSVSVKENPDRQKKKRFRSEPDIEEYEEYPYEEKYQLLINKREGASIKCCNDCQAFIEILEWYGWWS